MGYVVPDSRRTEVLLRACDLGVGMQLSNIARDVGEDAHRRPRLPAGRPAGDARTVA